MTFTFAVDFAVDHAAMAAAEYGTSFVTVMADDATEAGYLACGMAAVHGIPTATRLVATNV